MFTPIFASGKFVGELIFLDWNKCKKSKKLCGTDRIHIKPKKSQSGREKISIMMYCCGTRLSHPRT